MLGSPLSTAQAAEPHSALVNASFASRAHLVGVGASELGDCPAALRKIATRTGGNCPKSGDVAWKASLEDTFKGEHHAFFQLKQRNNALAGV